MRIIADNRDYYDCIQAHGQDRELVYLRRPETVEFEHVGFNQKRPYPLFAPSRSGFRSDDPNGILHTIGFCGKIYACIEKRPPASPNYPYESSPPHFCYSVEDVDAYVRQHFPKRWSSYIANGKEQWRWRERGWDWRSRREAYVEWFDDCAKRRDEFADLFEAKRCPVFVGTVSEKHGVKDSIVYNSILSPFHFQRIVDPYAAFQEISMFLGNLAWPDTPMLQMSNDDTAARLGHGDAYSFRRAPSKHR